MKITAIRRSRHEIALDPPFPAAWDPEPRTRFVADIVRVETDEGLIGIGAGDAMPGFGGHEPLFLGRDPVDLERHERLLESLSFHYGRMWPLSLALWDLAGQAAGKPVWTLIAGIAAPEPPPIPCYASTGSRHPPDETAETVAGLVDAGFDAVKLRVDARDWHADLPRIEAARATLGDDHALMIDLNQAWHMPWDDGNYWTYDDALECVSALAAFDPFWIEEPLHRADRAGMVRLRATTGLRLAGGEMAREVSDLVPLMESPALDVFQPDATLVGGIGGLAAFARDVLSRGLMFTPHSWGNGIGLIANAHLLAGVYARAALACPPLEYPLDEPGFPIAARDFPLAEPVEADAHGRLVLPEGPGLGITLDEERLAATEIARA